MANRGYGQFCPVALASEVLGTRWTILVLRELLCGSTHFNELRKGLPRMSPALLSKRLHELEETGLLVRRLDEATDSPSYHLTEAGQDLLPVVMAIGAWGQRWLESQLSLKNLDPSLLMWDMRRNLNPDPLPNQKITVQFLYPEVKRGRRQWWLIVDKAAEPVVDLCWLDPGHEVDLYVVSDLRTMTAIWMGIMTVSQAIEDGKLELNGAPELQTAMQEWLGLSQFAQVEKQVKV
ncbi:helix-turn-helix domain-containing protein [Nodosilinea sp. P-1105]|uniref:winged helix-turn-helix transcriptional regulator n=1 Tax=Nodosilinea sp. P-1105 TaxID=2546229 RepID=UPI00146BE8D0|nr:helix-turn-helix domain-containing protein [Nodosilinea sp. P-1105]NMF86548.1 transcriptional regulator [Nodosilinea sp. P-1105]